MGGASITPRYSGGRGGGASGVSRGGRRTPRGCCRAGSPAALRLGGLADPVGGQGERGERAQEAAVRLVLPGDRARCPSSRCDAAGRGCGGSRPARRRRPSRRSAPRCRRSRGPARPASPRRAATPDGAGRRRPQPPRPRAARRRGRRAGGWAGGPAIRSWKVMGSNCPRQVVEFFRDPADIGPARPRHRGQGPVAGPLRALPRLLHDPGRLDDRLGGDPGDHRGPARRA